MIDRDAEDELKQIARLRLAAILFDDKQYDDALRTLDAKHDEAFAGIYADLRGDILAAAGRADEARTAYQTALARLDAKSAVPQFRAGEARRARRRRRRRRREAPRAAAPGAADRARRSEPDAATRHIGPARADRCRVANVIRRRTMHR